MKRRLHAKRWIYGAVLALVVGGLGLFYVSGDEGVAAAYSPESTQPDGVKALADLTRETGGTFEVGALPGPQDKSAVLFTDTLNEEETKRVEEWVRAGGTLVVTDINSSFTSEIVPTAGSTRPPLRLVPGCNNEFVAGVSAIEPQAERMYGMFAPAPGSMGVQPCFVDRQGGAFMTVQPQGLGRLVVLGGAEVFTNAELDEADNSVLAANLLDIGSGSTVTYLRTEAIEGGDKTLGDLVSPGVFALVWQLAIAGLLLIAWRWRRLGDPIIESRPVELPGSSLVVAVGNLLQTAGRERRAAALMRRDLHRKVAERMGLPPDVDVERLIEVVVARTGAREALVREALTKSDVADEQALIELAQKIERTYQEVTHGR